MPGRLVIYGSILTDGQVLPPARVEIVDGRIAAIDPRGTSSDADLLVDDGYIAPGLIDLQVNGAVGVDLTAARGDVDAVAQVARVLASHGVTSWCPTIVSSMPDVIRDSLPGLGRRIHEGGATSLGAHVEGPFIAPTFRGVHDPKVLRLATRGEVETWLEISPPAMATLAPELPGGLEAIGQLRAAGVVPSLGHSGASLEEARAAFEAGASLATHLFNAMPPLHHRRPGLVGALLASGATLGLIADGVHVDAVLVTIAIRAAGARRIAIVSDAVAAAGAPPGRLRLGEQTVVSDGVTVRRDDGTLAGSAMLLADALRNLRAWLPELSPAEVLLMATGTPARALGAEVASRKGRVAPGYDADLVLIDRELRVRTTVIRGEVVDAVEAAS